MLRKNQKVRFDIFRRPFCTVLNRRYAYDPFGISREMTDIHGNLLWYGEYTAWGRLKKDERVHQ
ncbi:RHS domain-containing protein [Streptococcus sp. 2A/TPW/M5]